MNLKRFIHLLLKLKIRPHHNNKTYNRKMELPILKLKGKFDRTKKTMITQQNSLR